MDELELITRYRAGIGEPHPDDVARVRAAILASATGPRPRAGRAPRTTLRFAVAGLTVAGVLAALVIPGSSFLAPSGTPPDNQQLTQPMTTTSQPPADTESPPPQARQVLLSSADRALRLSERTGAYWYSKLLSPGSNPQDPPLIVEHWTSRSQSRSITSDAPYCPTPVDSDTGACIPKPAPDNRPLCPRFKRPAVRDREALERELRRMREIMEMCRPRPSPPTDSTPNDIDVPLRFSLDLTMTETMKLPTSPAALAKMLKNRIRATAGGPVRDMDGSLFYHSGQLLQSAPLTPGTRSALFRIMADLDKVKLLGTLTDPAGRPGMGMMWGRLLKGQDSVSVFVFDPETTELMAEIAYWTDSLPRVDDLPNLDPVVEGTATILDSGWTDRIGERP
jgi:hypothetical protein